jgi:hypothetical protein
MTASFPGSIKVYSTKVDGVDDILAGHINDLQDEVIAIETQLDLMSGWIPISVNPVYVSATSMVFNGIDLTGILKSTVKFKYFQGGVWKYGYVASTNLASGNTTVNFVANSNFSVANAGISAARFSYQTPPDFPCWFTWAPTFSGYSSGPSGVMLFSIEGRKTNLILDIAGPSNGIALTMTLPVLPTAGASIKLRVVDNGAVLASVGYLSILTGNLTATAYPALNGGNWTGANNKGFLTQDFYAS